jgi:succinate-semialdehyde dehydrogenase/glutarate-semialdehyde dehydrogenase
VQGEGLVSKVNLGPVINAAALDKVKAQVADAVSKGGVIIAGGEEAVHLVGEAKSGLFFQPTVITGATENMLVAQEETFGPVAFLFKVSMRGARRRRCASRRARPSIAT